MLGDMLGYSQEMYTRAQQQANPAGDCGGFWDALLGNVGALYLSSVTDTEGWVDYINCSPKKDVLCQFKQHEDGIPWVGYSSEFHPEFNVAYLKWRLTGIAKGPL